MSLISNKENNYDTQMERKIFNHDGIAIPFNEYRIDDMLPSEERVNKWISTEHIKALYTNYSSSGNHWLRNKQKVIKYIIREFINVLIERLLEGQVFVHGDTSIYIGYKKEAKPTYSKKRTTLFSTKGKAVRIHIDTSFEHNYYLRMKGKCRYELVSRLKRGQRYIGQ